MVASEVDLVEPVGRLVRQLGLQIGQVRPSVGILELLRKGGFDLLSEVAHCPF